MSIEAMKMALEALEDVPLKPTEWSPAVEALRQAIEQAEKQRCPCPAGECAICVEKISLSRIKLGERFVLVRTGQIYSKTKDGYWNEAEQRPARLHLNCQVQLIKEKNL